MRKQYTPQQKKTPMTAPAVNDTEDRNRRSLSEEADRTDRSVDTREHDDFYALPDFANIDFSESANHQLQLYAPDPRTDEREGLMHQRWVNVNMNNGRRLDDLRKLGYVPRNPKTVPRSFSLMTEKWQGHDVIMVAGEMMLMEVPVKYHKQFQKAYDQKINGIMSSIQKKHGTLMNSENKLKDPGTFMREVQVEHENVGGEISFD